MEKKDKIANLLKEVNYPGFSRDIISFGIVKDIDDSGKEIVISLELPIFFFAL